MTYILFGILLRAVLPNLIRTLFALSPFDLDHWRIVCCFLRVGGMNSIFEPIFMTFHKVTNTNIIQYQGRLTALYTPIPVGAILANLNWDLQWDLVFKRLIPLFWYPAYIITFILPPSFRMLFVALLGVALGLILAHRRTEEVANLLVEGVYRKDYLRECMIVLTICDDRV